MLQSQRAVLTNRTLHRTRPIVMVVRIRAIGWQREPDCWGSDRYPIFLEFPTHGHSRLRRCCRVVHWDAFRKAALIPQDQSPQDLQDFLRKALDSATKTSWVDESRPAPDLQLLRLWRPGAGLNLLRLDRGRWLDWCASLDPRHAQPLSGVRFVQWRRANVSPTQRLRCF
ncbi:hypothetical protein HPB52_007614 [Rhipicephalus sanguineus]|uniref:Uncharacterized protein n=1 Tax=Rhipicephalus sanguineus TaxID=34632 RepID=A0A9D4T1E6_RHISA|nr:hypothetical protein HPB52_007614 [Rhipicephalus sanguineus]